MKKFEVNVKADSKDIYPIIEAMVNLFNSIHANPIHVFIALDVMKNRSAEDLVKQGLVKPTPIPSGLRVVTDGEV